MEARYGVGLSVEGVAEAESPRDLLRALRSAAGASGRPRTPIEAPPEVHSGLAPPAGTATLVHALQWHAARHPGRVHVHLLDESGESATLTYGDLYDGARRVAGGLATRGLDPGESVAIMLPTGFEYLQAVFGVLLAGGVPVPIYPPTRLSQLEDHLRRHARILDNARARWLVTFGPALAVSRLLSRPDRLSARRPRRGPVAGLRPCGARVVAGPRRHCVSAVHLRQHRQSPRGVVLTHADLLESLNAMHQALEIEGGDVFVSWLPLYHDMGLIGAWLGSLFYAMPFVLMSPLVFLARPVRMARGDPPLPRDSVGGAELCLRAVPEAHRGVRARRARPRVVADRLQRGGAGQPGYSERLCGTLRSLRLRSESADPGLRPRGSDARGDFHPGRPRPALRSCGPRHDAAPRPRGLRRRSGVIPPSLSREAVSRSRASRCVRSTNRGARLWSAGSDGYSFAAPPPPRGTSGIQRPPARSSTASGSSRAISATSRKASSSSPGGSRISSSEGDANVYPHEVEEAAGEVEGVRRGCVAVFGSEDRDSGTERLVVVAETRENERGARASMTRAIEEVALRCLGSPPDEVLLVPPYTVLKTSSGKIRRGAVRGALRSGAGSEFRNRGCRCPCRYCVWVSAPWSRQCRRALGRAVDTGYAGWFWSATALVGVVLWPAVVLARSPRRAGALLRVLARALLRVTGLRPRVEGTMSVKGERGRVLVFNHASYIDGLVLSAVLDRTPSYVAKRELRRFAFSRLFLEGIGSLFVERFERRRSAEDAEAITAALAGGRRSRDLCGRHPAPHVRAIAISARRLPLCGGSRCAGGADSVARHPLGAAQRILVSAPRRCPGSNRAGDRPCIDRSRSVCVGARGAPARRHPGGDAALLRGARSRRPPGAPRPRGTLRRLRSSVLTLNRPVRRRPESSAAVQPRPQVPRDSVASGCTEWAPEERRSIRSRDGISGCRQGTVCAPTGLGSVRGKWCAEERTVRERYAGALRLAGGSRQCAGQAGAPRSARCGRDLPELFAWPVGLGSVRVNRVRRGAHGVGRFPRNSPLSRRAPSALPAVRGSASAARQKGGRGRSQSTTPGRSYRRGRMRSRRTTRRGSCRADG